MSVHRGRGRPGGARHRNGIRLAITVAGLFLASVVVLGVRGVVPLWVAAAYAFLSGAAYALYAHDKSAAVRGGGRRRTPESTLHTVDLLGGWPGGLVARHVLRHKTVKQPFRGVFWVTVVVNVAALACWLWRVAR